MKLKEEKEEENEVFPFIHGERIDLVAQLSKWAEIYARWHNDPRVRQYARHEFPIALEDVKKWFESTPEHGVRDFIVFVIYHKLDKRHWEYWVKPYQLGKPQRKYFRRDRRTGILGQGYCR